MWRAIHGQLNGVLIALGDTTADVAVQCAKRQWSPTQTEKCKSLSEKAAGTNCIGCNCYMRQRIFYDQAVIAKLISAAHCEYANMLGLY